MKPRCHSLGGVVRLILMDMWKTCRMGSAVAGLALLLAARAGVALDPQWYGTWRLNRSMSHLVGPSMVIGRTARGYRFDLGLETFEVGEDGKEAATGGARTTSLKPVGKHAWYRVDKVRGKEVGHSTLTLTEDDRVLTIRTVAEGLGGKEKTKEEKEDRIGGGEGLVGTWRGRTAGANVPETLLLREVGEGKVLRELPGNGQFYVAELDGGPVAYEGPRAVAGMTVALRSVSPTQVRWTESVGGRGYTEGIDTLSFDGKRLVEVTWAVARPADRQEAVYDRFRAK